MIVHCTLYSATQRFILDGAKKVFLSSKKLFSSNTNLCDSGYYDYDDYYNNMQGYEAYMQKWVVMCNSKKTDQSSKYSTTLHPSLWKNTKDHKPTI